MLSQVEYYNEYLKMCLANLRAEERGGAGGGRRRVRFHRIRGNAAAHSHRGQDCIHKSSIFGPFLSQVVFFHLSSISDASN